MTSRSLATMAVLVLALAGCGGDADDADDTAATEPAAAATEPAAATEAEAEATGEPTDGDVTEGAESGVTVTVQGIAFQDASVTVAAGSPVTWNNQDSAGHTVTSGSPDDPTGVFDQSLPANGEVTITVDEPGTYAYFCQIHPNMTAELVVEAA